jgi:hypothetical protein
VYSDGEVFFTTATGDACFGSGEIQEGRREIRLLEGGEEV